MRTFHKLLLAALSSLLVLTGASAQSTTQGADDRVVTFKFVPGRDMFYIPWGGNNAELNRLYSLVEEYRAQIASGTMPVYVDGYCAADLRIAAVRSNRVKSELITNKGLTEENFVTHNHAAAYTDPDGVSRRDMVVVTLRIPAKPQPAPRQPEPVREESKRNEPPVTPAQQPEPTTEPQTQPQHEPTVAQPTVPVKPYCFAVRTNLLYDALLMPTLGVEWRINPSIGVKLDGSLSWWGSEHGRVQKTWLLNPEVRWYMGDAKRFYLGAAANFGEYNLYRGMLGGLVSKDTGYQGKLWGGGATVGYQLPLSRSLSLDFNLGLGYNRFKYDTFGVTDEVRVYKATGLTKNILGPTQAGINLVWTIGGNKR